MLATQLLHVMPEMCRKHFSRSLLSSSASCVPGFFPSDGVSCSALLSAACSMTAGMAQAVLSTWHGVISAASAAAASEHSVHMQIHSLQWTATQAFRPLTHIHTPGLWDLISSPSVDWKRPLCNIGLYGWKRMTLTSTNSDRLKQSKQTVFQDNLGM